MSDWNRTEDIKPNDGQAVTVITPSGEEHDAVYSDGLWFFGDVYCYYTPPYWKDRPTKSGEAS